MTTPRSSKKTSDPLPPDSSLPDELEPFRDDWLHLTPAERLMISWRMRRQVRDLEADHDEKSLPRL